MNDYFDQTEQRMRDAIRRRAHLPWWVRVRGISRTRGLVVLIAALVVAAPAIGAVTNWFGIGAPDHFPKTSPTMNLGRAFAATSELLSLRVPDPQGGPPWGLRLVRTTRGDTCVQYGRVEDDQIGSLGIDYAWNDDRLFHAFPDTAAGWNCGTDDGDGHAFFNVSLGGIPGSANPSSNAHGPQGKDCAVQPGRTSTLPTCPAGSSRVVFFGLLGPDAVSVSYRAPNGRTEIARTAGPDGAYLLVFQFDAHTCYMYSHSARGSFSPCTSQGFAGASPNQPGAVTAIHYRDGHTCGLEPSPTFTRRYEAFLRPLEAQLRRVSSKAGRQALVARYRRLLPRWLAEQHLSLARFQQLQRGICPAVGYVAPKQKRLTEAEVAAPLKVKVIRHTRYGPKLVVSFLARQPVTSSDSWYEIAVTNPGHGCEGGGSSGRIGYGNVRVGQRLTTSQYLQSCRGVFHGVVGYMQNGGPINAQFGGGGGTPGKDGSIVVGRFRFRFR